MCTIQRGVMQYIVTVGGGLIFCISDRCTVEVHRSGVCIKLKIKENRYFYNNHRHILKRLLLDVASFSLVGSSFSLEPTRILSVTAYSWQSYIIAFCRHRCLRYAVIDGRSRM
jgi:hypothetical protein